MNASRKQVVIYSTQTLRVLGPGKTCEAADFPLDPADWGKFTWNGRILYVSDGCLAQFNVRTCPEAAANQTCTISGDPHFETPDGKKFKFTGQYPCDYTLANVKMAARGKGYYNMPPRHVKINGTFVQCKTTCLNKITIDIRGRYEDSTGVYILGPGDAVKKSGVGQIDLPFKNTPTQGSEVTIEEEGESIRVWLGYFGIAVYWDKHRKAVIAFPKDRFSNSNGMCGSRNGNPDDDLGGLSVEEFGLQYLVDGSCTEE